MDLYVLRYQSGNNGCPDFLSGEFLPDRFEWNPDAPWKGELASIRREYKFCSKVAAINFDVYSFSCTLIVSNEFRQVCVQLGVSFDAVPLSIVLPGGENTSKRYQILLIKEYEEALDRAKSDFVDATDMETGKPARNLNFPEAYNYEKIDLFTLNEKIYPSLFFCIETGDLFCTEEFKFRAEKEQLIGVRFQPIDATYRYDPIGDLLAP